MNHSKLFKLDVFFNYIVCGSKFERWNDKYLIKLCYRIYIPLVSERIVIISKVNNILIHKSSVNVLTNWK